MMGLDYALAGFMVCYLLVCAVSLVFAVREYRAWNLSGNILLFAGLLLIAAPFIWPLVSHAVQRKLQERSVDCRILKIKLAFSWFVVLAMIVGNRVCTVFCKYTVDRMYSEELALCCALAFVFLIMLFGLWLHAKLNELLGAGQ